MSTEVSTESEKNIDLRAFGAAANELRPLRRMVLRKAIWEGRSPDDVVTWLNSQGVDISTERVIELFWGAMEYCLQRARQRTSPSHIALGERRLTTEITLWHRCNRLA